MGRFYKTNTPQYIDYSYQMPWEQSMTAFESEMQSIQAENYSRAFASAVDAETYGSLGPEMDNELNSLETDFGDVVDMIKAKDPTHEAKMKELAVKTKALFGKNGNVGMMRDHYAKFQQIGANARKKDSKVAKQDIDNYEKYIQSEVSKGGVYGLSNIHLADVPDEYDMNGQIKEYLKTESFIKDRKKFFKETTDASGNKVYSLDDQMSDLFFQEYPDIFGDNQVASRHITSKEFDKVSAEMAVSSLAASDPNFVNYYGWKHSIGDNTVTSVDSFGDFVEESYDDKLDYFGAVSAVSAESFSNSHIKNKQQNEGVDLITNVSAQNEFTSGQNALNRANASNIASAKAAAKVSAAQQKVIDDAAAAANSAGGNPDPNPKKVGTGQIGIGINTKTSSIDDYARNVFDYQQGLFPANVNSINTILSSSVLFDPKNASHTFHFNDPLKKEAVLTAIDHLIADGKAYNILSSHQVTRIMSYREAIEKGGDVANQKSLGNDVLFKEKFKAVSTKSANDNQNNEETLTITNPTDWMINTLADQNTLFRATDEGTVANDVHVSNGDDVRELNSKTVKVSRLEADGDTTRIYYEPVRPGDKLYSTRYMLSDTKLDEYYRTTETSNLRGDIIKMYGAGTKAVPHTQLWNDADKTTQKALKSFITPGHNAYIQSIRNNYKENKVARTINYNGKKIQMKANSNNNTLVLGDISVNEKDKILKYLGIKRTEVYDITMKEIKGSNLTAGYKNMAINIMNGKMDVTAVGNLNKVARDSIKRYLAIKMISDRENDRYKKAENFMKSGTTMLSSKKTAKEEISSLLQLLNTN